MAGRARLRGRAECIFYLARSQERWPPVSFIGNEIGAKGGRAKPPSSRSGDRLVFHNWIQRRGRAGASRSVDRFLWIGIAFYRSFCTAFARLPGAGILANRSCAAGVEKRGRLFACESAEHCN